MSYVDTELLPGERDAFIDEIRADLPAFLSSAATEVMDPAGDVSALLDLRTGDLNRVVAVHLALSQVVTRFVAELPHGLRRPITSTERPRVAAQAIRGPIDWPATIRQRMSSPGFYVTRPAQRIFDTPENRALVWTLSRLDDELANAAPAGIDEDSGVHNPDWFARIVDARVRVQTAKKHHWLRGVPPERPGARALQALHAARTRFYKNDLRAVIDLLARYTENPTPGDITALVCERYFEPQRNWKLYELVVALRIARAVADRSVGLRKSRLLSGPGRSPYARYVLAGGDEIRLWYQGWPRDAGASAHLAASRRYEINSQPARPDLVAERRSNGVTVDAVLLELKASRSAATLSSGLLQLLTYLKDRPTLFGNKPGGWLVALPSTAFRMRSSGELELWAVTDEALPTALAQRLTD